MMREPWLLATSLCGDTAAGDRRHLLAANADSEESFRHTKSARFGWSLETAYTRRASRVDVMMVLTALASLLVLIVGIAAEAAGVHRGFQANTVRKRRCLALAALGRLVLLHACARAAPANVFPVAFEPRSWDEQSWASPRPRPSSRRRRREVRARRCGEGRTIRS